MNGQLIDKYRIARTIGRGGMGEVLEAEHTITGRRVAIKILHPQFARDATLVQRFLNEARAATVIGHSGIVDILDAGTQPDGSAFVVMELLQGESLAGRLRRVRVLDIETALEIARQAADAVGAAHLHGIVHRDLKPDNIFLVAEAGSPGGERVKLLDFGIAKLSQDVSGLRTGTSEMMGTPLYMSPEQCRAAARVDARSDVYALGCILFEMCCGRPPFLAHGLGEIFAAHLHQQPPDPRQLVPSISGELADLITRCLAKDPDRRPASAIELGRDLAALPAAGPSVRTTAMPPVPSAALAATAPSIPRTAAVVEAPPTIRRGTTQRRLAIALAEALLVGGGGLAGIILARGGGGSDTTAARSAAAQRETAEPAAAPAPITAPGVSSVDAAEGRSAATAPPSPADQGNDQHGPASPPNEDSRPPASSTANTGRTTPAPGVLPPAAKAVAPPPTGTLRVRWSLSHGEHPQNCSLAGVQGVVVTTWQGDRGTQNVYDCMWKEATISLPAGTYAYTVKLLGPGDAVIAVSKAASVTVPADGVVEQQLDFQVE